MILNLLIPPLNCLCLNFFITSEEKTSIFFIQDYLEFLVQCSWILIDLL